MATFYNTSVVRNGLVLHLDAANIKSYPGTGTTWNDLSGRNNHGTLNSVTYDTITPKNMLFDNDADYVSVTHSPDFNFSSVLSVSVWIKINSFNTGIYNIISKKSTFNNSQPGWSCQYDYRTTGILQFRNNDGSTLNDSTPTANIDNTILLNQTTRYVNSVWIISGTSITYYINGQLRGNDTAAFANTNTSQPLNIGKTTGSAGDLAPLSNISNVLLYNRVLSVQEIQQNFEAMRDRYGI